MNNVSLTPKRVLLEYVKHACFDEKQEAKLILGINNLYQVAKIQQSELAFEQERNKEKSGIISTKDSTIQALQDTITLRNHEVTQLTGENLSCEKKRKKKGKEKWIGIVTGYLINDGLRLLFNK